MSSTNKMYSPFPLGGVHGNFFVLPEQHGLPRPESGQKLSPLDMNMPRLYGTRWILCFSMDSSASKAQIYESLKLGLAHTISSIPWIAGNIGPEEGRDPMDNRIQVVHSSSGVQLRYNDLTDALPSYTELQEKHFPLSKLTTGDLSPISLMGGPPYPVMAAQANFIEGGLLLTVGVHHSASDASAVDTILDTWAQNTTEAISSLEPLNFSSFDPPSNDRSSLTVGIGGARLIDFPEYIVQPTTPASASADLSTHETAKMPFYLPPMTAQIFHFSPTSLAELKATAAAYSTYDALSAFVWRCVTRARNPGFTTSKSDVSLGSTEQTSTLLSAVNIRTRTSPPLPHSYLGNASMATITDRVNVLALISSSGLVMAASAIRRSIQKLIHTPNRIPLTIGLLNSRPNPTDFKFAYHGFLGPDVSTTSWADLRLYERVWGPLGKVVSLRVPYEEADGAIVIFPKLKTGGLEVMVALEAAVMQRMTDDSEFLGKAEIWA